MDQRLSLVTLGVSDLPRSVAFYTALGWKPNNDVEAQDVAFFQGPGTVIALWHRDELAKDSVVEDSGGWGGITLAYNTRNDAEVDEVIEQARAAGAKIGREPAETFWGGYSAIFIDPDGHPWEVAHNPNWRITEEGQTRLD
jgi:catechol 2,3-dioxygenase-like lactoylglutathione lyase family enzyme